MHTRRRFLSLSAGTIAAVASGAGLTACSAAQGSPGDIDAGPPQSGGTITLAEPTSPIGWDPHVGTEDLLGLILRPVFDSLVAARTDGTFAPWLATSWTISPDGLNYTFTLRKDVTFTDGTPFDAAAVRANFDHVVAPGTASRYAKSLLGPYVGTTVLDQSTVRITLSRPYSQFLQAVSSTYLGFHSPKALREHPHDLGSGGRYTVTTGAFTFASVTQGQQAVFKRRPDYKWGPGSAKHTGPAYLDGFTVMFVLDDQTRVGAATAGQVDIADQVPASQLPVVRNMGSVRLISRDSPGAPYSYYMNTGKPLFSDVNARKVMLHGVDVDGITKGLFQGQYQPASSVLSPSTRDFADLADQLGYHPDRAESLLAALGYTDTDGAGYRTRNGQRFAVRMPFATANTTDERRAFNTAVQDGLKQIGVDLVLTELDAPTYINRARAGDYDLSALAWGGSDGAVLWNLFYSKNLVPVGGANVAWVADQTLDALLTGAENTTDQDKQRQFYRQAQARVIDQAYVRPAYVAKRGLAVRPEVHGFSFDAAGWPFIYDIWRG
ncbi:ABC transporter substrate-binding protein [Kutzneria buriramensis]|uniref:Peptide/nickel transport system substrate-binding protein n=1 Tax=Kutzneria buriramensis TaxID=1045776 RepID=A0A3E0GU79_9PSEU|nr:ABC transporter substrate-binding protein [Kutzneria buriramensis]REH27618.1 peptide/nickel transport system substrate-binding protein [Kutzneria buriramensis]